jgi:hypothetical protein
MVGIALAGDDNRIRAVANSLRLPLKKWAVSPMPPPESDICRAFIRLHCTTPRQIGGFFETGRVSVLASCDFPANRDRREPRLPTIAGQFCSR